MFDGFLKEIFCAVMKLLSRRWKLLVVPTIYLLQLFKALVPTK